MGPRVPGATDSGPRSEKRKTASGDRIPLTPGVGEGVLGYGG